jgi:hypothetical protein
MSGMRMTRVGKERQARAAAMLGQLEAYRADAGSYPEHLAELAGSTDALSYNLCPDGGFELSYTDPSPGGFLPSDFERRFNPDTRAWDLKEIGVDPRCQ